MADLPALPRAAEWVAPERWQAIDFISDLHLSAALPRTFEAWAAYMHGTTADAVVILGDLFEFWPGSDAVQLDFEASCLQVLRSAAQRCHVALMVGNRDFLLEPALLQQWGVRWLDDPTLLRAWCHVAWLTHGDALCLDDLAYQQFRAVVRDAKTQAAPGRRRAPRQRGRPAPRCAGGRLARRGPHRVTRLPARSGCGDDGAWAYPPSGNVGAGPGFAAPCAERLGSRYPRPARRGAAPAPRWLHANRAGCRLPEPMISAIA